MKNLNIDSLTKLLASYKSKRITLTFHSIGDSDGVASAVALSKYFTNSTIVTPNIITRNAQRMLDRVGYTKKITNTMPPQQDLIIILDTNNFDSLEQIKGKVQKSPAQKVFIDHHLYPKQSYINTNLFNDEGFNSTSSIIFEVMQLLPKDIDRASAELLLYGIISDSADFKNATAKTFFQIATLLLRSGLTYQEIHRNLEEHLSAEIRYKAINDISNAKTEMVRDYVLMYGKSSTHANAVAERAIRTGADAAVFWAANKNEVSISARLKVPLDKELSIHLGKIMQEIGPMLNGTGGGHPAAAGAYGPNIGAIQSAMTKTVDLIRESLRS